MEEKKSKLYLLIKETVRFFFPKMTVEGTDLLPPEPVIVVSNHCQMNGPIASELYFPGKRLTWCAGQMMHRKEVPEYAFQDFWGGQPKWTHWFYRLLSHLIAPLSELIFTNADTIGVYRDGRILSTFKKTVSALCDGCSVVIFPEHDVPHNHILYDFQDKFIDIARLYYKKSGKSLSFVPMYITPQLKKMVLGKPIVFDPDAPMEEERRRICTALMAAITDLAEALPEHRVVPYPNVPKAQYPSNKSSR